MLLLRVIPDILLDAQSLPGGSEEPLQHPLQGKPSVTSVKSAPSWPGSSHWRIGVVLLLFFPAVQGQQGSQDTRAEETVVPGPIHTGTEACRGLEKEQGRRARSGAGSNELVWSTRLDSVREASAQAKCGMNFE